MSRTLRVLIVEDNPADAEMVLRELRRAGYDPQWERVDTEADYVARLEGKPDLVLADYTMPHFSAKRALTVLQEMNMDLPFLIISGTIGEDQAVEVMRQGAWDYLLKDRMGRLGAAVALAMEKKRLRREYVIATEALKASEHKYRHLFQTLTEAAILVDCGTRRIVDLNPSAEKLLGKPRDLLLGADESVVFPAVHSGGNRGRLTAAVATKPPSGCRMEAEVAKASGETVRVVISITPVQFDQRSQVLALFTEIPGKGQKMGGSGEAQFATEAAGGRMAERSLLGSVGAPPKPADFWD